MARKSPRSVSVNTNVKCLQLYPTEDTKKSITDLKTIGIRLSREQAVHLCRVFLLVSQDWEKIEITGY